jgi:hypothetical protein
VTFRGAIAIGVVAAIACGAREAAACSPVFEPSFVARPVFEPAVAVQIAGETVDVTCDERACEVTAVYRIDAHAPATATVFATRRRAQTIIVDGNDGGSIPAGARELRVVTTVELWPFGSPCYLDGVLLRHRRFGSAPPRSQRIIAIETVAVPEVRRHPASWRLRIDQSRDHVRGAGWNERYTARLWFDLPEPRALHGGPLFLAGIASGTGNTLRLRGGWEVAAPRWVLLGLAVDTDVARIVSVAVTAQPATTAWVGTMTSWSAGGGVVARYEEGGHAEVGARGEIGASMQAARLAFSLDWYTRNEVSVAFLVGASI